MKEISFKYIGNQNEDESSSLQAFQFSFECLRVPYLFVLNHHDHLPIRAITIPYSLLSFLIVDVWLIELGVYVHTGKYNGLSPTSREHGRERCCPGRGRIRVGTRKIILKSLDVELSEHSGRTLQLSRNRISIHHAFRQTVSLPFYLFHCGRPSI